MNSPQPTLTLVEWSVLGLLGAGIGVMVASGLGARRMGPLWLGALGGTVGGLALGTSIWPPPGGVIAAAPAPATSAALSALGNPTSNASGS